MITFNPTGHVPSLDTSSQRVDIDLAKQQVDDPIHFVGSKIQPGVHRNDTLKLLLDVMMPNGKLLRRCTGHDCGYLKHNPSGVSKLCAVLEKQLAPDELVGSKFSEPDVRAMWNEAYVN